jgi:hypothetical protein
MRACIRGPGKEVGALLEELDAGGGVGQHATRQAPFSGQIRRLTPEPLPRVSLVEIPSAVAFLFEAVVVEAILALRPLVWSLNVRFP